MFLPQRAFWGGGLLRSQPSGLPAGAQAQWQHHCSPKFTVINLNDCLYRAQHGTDPPSILRPRRAAFVSWCHLAPLPGLRKVGRWQGHPPPSAEARENTPVRERGERLFKVHAHSKSNPSWGLGVRPRGGRWSSGLGCGSPSSGPGSTPNHKGTLGPTGLSGPQFPL